MDNLLAILVGVVLLFAGRKLYWLFVGLVGFAAGLALSTTLLKVDAEWLKWLIAIGFGVLGAILAVGLQKVAVGVAGFIAGGYGLVYLMEILGINIENANWIFFIVGGIIGLVLVLAVFEYALIILSSIVGSVLVSQRLPISEALVTAAFLVMVLVGFLVQWATLRAEGKEAG